MHSPGDLQAGIRDAVVLGRMAAVVPALRGGGDPARRLAIHHRHYTASLRSALVEKFPATAWLAGPAAVHEAASAFVRRHPPRRPCIAEYGAAFPAFLAARLGGRVPYLQAFAELEWLAAQASIAVEEPALTWAEVAAHGAAALEHARLALQPATRYLHADCAIDALMRVYLTGAEPSAFVLDRRDAWTEVRGARGTLQLNSLPQPAWVFRSSLRAGASIAAAAVRALDADPEFDLARALTDLVACGLVTRVLPEEGTA